MKRYSALLVIALVVSAVASLSPLPIAAADALSESEFRKLHALLLSPDTEPWRTIPWRISLLEAQRTAAREKKPIFRSRRQWAG